MILSLERLPRDREEISAQCRMVSHPASCVSGDKEYVGWMFLWTGTSSVFPAGRFWAMAPLLYFFNILDDGPLEGDFLGEVNRLF